MADESETLKEDLKFLISFVPARTTTEVVEGLSKMYYVTGSYEGDVELATRIENIMERHGIDPSEIDENEDFEDEV